MNELLQKGNSLLGERHNACVPRGTSNKGLLQSLAALSMSALFAMPAVAAGGPFAFVADSAVRIIDLRSNQTFPNMEWPNETISAFAMTKDGSKLYELYLGDEGVGVRNTATNKYGTPLIKKGVINVSPLVTVGGAALTPDERYFLVATGSEVVVIDTTTGTIVKRIDKALNVVNPADIKISPSGKDAYVTDQCGGIAVISLSSWNVSKTIDLAPGYLTQYATTGKCQNAVRPSFLEMDPVRPAAYVLDSAVGTVTKIDVSTGAVVAVINTNGKPRHIAINSSGDKAYVASDVSQIGVIDLNNYMTASPIQTDSPAIDLAAYQGGTIYGIFEKLPTNEQWLSSIDGAGTVTKRVPIVPGARRLWVGDLATDLATLFSGQGNPSVPVNQAGEQASSNGQAASTSDGGGGGGGCSVGHVTEATDPMLPVLALGAMVFLWSRRRSMKNL